MRRRDFIGGLGIAIASPVVARAQQSAVPVIGFLHAGSREGAATYLQAFHKGLAEFGFVEGRNVVVEYRWADGRIDRLPSLATDLARLDVSVIVATISPAGRAASAATSKIPIVFFAGADPVNTGLVASFSRPGSNLTGVTSLTAELLPKRLELLHEAVPSATTLAVLLNQASSGSRPPEELELAVRSFGMRLEVVRAAADDELDTAFATLAREPAVALMIPPNAFFLDRRARLGQLALQYEIPAIHSYREFAAAGGLMSYGGSFAELGREVGIYTARVLRGEKPADLPVQQITKVELVINMKAAKALGLTFPLKLLGRADEVIE